MNIKRRVHSISETVRDAKIISDAVSGLYGVVELDGRSWYLDRNRMRSEFDANIGDVIPVPTFGTAAVIDGHILTIQSTGTVRGSVVDVPSLRTNKSIDMAYSGRQIVELILGV